MSDVLLSFRGREIRVGEVAFLRELIAQNPTLSRRALSARECSLRELGTLEIQQVRRRDEEDLLHHLRLKQRLVTH